MQKSESIKELAVALSRAQGELEHAAKSSKNPHFNSKYADLAEVLDTVRPALAKHGMAVLQFPAYSPNDGGVVVVETVLVHQSGEFMTGAIGIPLGPKKDAQAVGSAITYARRYSLAAVLGIAQDDDDGNAASGNKKNEKTTKRDPEDDVTDAIKRLMTARDSDQLGTFFRDLPPYVQKNGEVIQVCKNLKESWA